jgi:hypothetical protein
MKAMSITLQELRQALWNPSDGLSLTEHEKELAGNLDATADLEIRGKIGSGKTFTIRKYLQNNEIGFEYYTVRQLLEAEGTMKITEEVKTVVIDNFDAIPEQRDPLEQIYKRIENDLLGIKRGVWLVLPENFQNRWFESCLGGFEPRHIQRREINQIHVDHVKQNLRSIAGTDRNSVSVDNDSLSKCGYHTIVTTFSDHE